MKMFLPFQIPNSRVFLSFFLSFQLFKFEKKKKIYIYIYIDLAILKNETKLILFGVEEVETETASKYGSKSLI